MYGKNVITKPFPNEDGSLKVHSMWYTIQGEGPDAGRPAVFLRLSHCNLACFFCDTQFDSGEVLSIDTLENQLAREFTKGQSDLLVITGGEPLLQNVLPVVDKMNACGIAVSIETAGTTFLPGLETRFAADRSIHGNLLVCSPKTPKLAPKLVPLIGALKYIIRKGEYCALDGLPTRSTQKEGKPSNVYRPAGSKIPIFVQPMDEGNTRETDENEKAAAYVCMEHGYRLSLQLHKIVGLD